MPAISNPLNTLGLLFQCVIDLPPTERFAPGKAIIAWKNTDADDFGGPTSGIRAWESHVVCKPHLTDVIERAAADQTTRNLRPQSLVIDFADNKFNEASLYQGMQRQKQQQNIRGPQRYE